MWYYAFSTLINIGSFYGEFNVWNRAWELHCHLCTSKYARSKVEYFELLLRRLCFAENLKHGIDCENRKDFQQPFTVVHPCPAISVLWCEIASREKAPDYLRHTRPFVRMYLSGSHWTDVRGIWYWGLIWISVEETQIWLRVKNIGHCTWRPKYVRLLPATRNLHKSALFWVKWYKTARIFEEVWTLRERGTVLRYTYIACLVLVLTLYLISVLSTVYMPLCNNIFTGIDTLHYI